MNKTKAGRQSRPVECPVGHWNLVAEVPVPTDGYVLMLDDYSPVVWSCEQYHHSMRPDAEVWRPGREARKCYMWAEIRLPDEEKRLLAEAILKPNAEVNATTGRAGRPDETSK